MLKFGNITLDLPFFQAPLSGYSDYAMRKLAHDFGCPLTFVGVMLAKSAAQPKVLAKAVFRPHDDEHPIGAQILGAEPAVMAKAAKDLVNAGYDLIDLNFACPAPKVLRRGRGGALLNQPDKAIEIFRQVRDAVTCPLSVKLRIGYNRKPESVDNFWGIVEGTINFGADALVVHGRTVVEKFRGVADWKILAEIKQNFPDTTIIGSGDLFDAETIVEKMNSTGVDGIVIARGAIGNPWIFRDLKALFETGTAQSGPSIEQQKQTILYHLQMVSQLYDKKKNTGYFRKFLANYSKLHPDRKKVGKILLAAQDKAQLLAAIEKCYA